MGYSFIPVFIGNIFAGIISGNVYQAMSDKHSILLKEIEKKGLTIDSGLSHNEFFHKAAGMMDMTDKQLTDYLWNNYHPSYIWIVIFSIGIVAAISLRLYNRYVVKE